MSLNAIDHSGAGGSGSSSFTQGDSILHRRRLSQVAATLQPVSDEEAAVQRALLSQVQSRSTSFRGFSENELDLLFPYLNIVEFQNGDPIMKTGEEVLRLSSPPASQLPSPIAVASAEGLAWQQPPASLSEVRVGPLDEQQQRKGRKHGHTSGSIELWLKTCAEGSGQTIG